uniref:DUF4283 domain-containing protein n=1 Tax=Populus alba TaxID=43335 RepID=A0A4U5Q9U1_POPAL|nr:hypothetical protein D5086_0000120850 [Populus alba]
MDVGGGASPTNVVAGTSLTSTPGSRVWKDFFSASKPTAPCITLKNFSLNHLTKSCAISPEDFQPQFEVWNLCVVGYVSGKNPGTWLSMELSPLFGSVKLHFTIHDSGWLIYRFTREEDKLFVLNGGPYLIASVLGKPIQSDHITSTLSRLSYTRMLVEIDLREDLQHFVVVSLSSGPTLHQKAIYEALSKFYNYCNVLGHTRLLCPKAAASATKPAVVKASTVHAGKGSVFGRLGPHILPTPTGV